MSSTFEEYKDRCPPSSHFWAPNEWSVAFSQGSAAAFPRRKKHKPIQRECPEAGSGSGVPLRGVGGSALDSQNPGVHCLVLTGLHQDLKMRKLPRGKSGGGINWEIGAEQYMHTTVFKVKVKSLSPVRLCDPMDCSLLGFSVHGILQARVLEWVAISFSRGSSRPRSWTQVPHTAGRCLTLGATIFETDNKQVCVAWRALLNTPWRSIWGPESEYMYIHNRFTSLCSGN